MKSKLFSKEFLPSDDFKKDFLNLVNLNPDQLSTLSNFISSLNFKELKLNAEDIYAISQKINKTTDETASIIRVSIFLLNYDTGESGNTCSNFIDDLFELGVIPLESKEKILTFFIGITYKAKELQVSKRKQIYESGVIPQLESLSHVTDLRLGLKEKYDPQTEIENYSPQPDSLIPIAVIRFILDDSQHKNAVLFQVNSSGLEKIIVHLQACQKELRLIEKLASECNLPKSEQGA